MLRYKDLTNKTFGDLIVIKALDERTPNGSVLWECLCSCGNTTKVTTNNLNNLSTSSCGCSRSKPLAHRGYAKNNTTRRLRNIWGGLKRRCFNTKNQNYKYYGGKGITMCDEWLDFKTFYNWAIESGYSNDLTLERHDNSKNYYPENCTWANWYTQAQHKGLSKINKSGTVGVYFKQQNQRWVASICTNNKHIYLGSYVNKEDAIVARKKAEVLYRD